MIKFILINDYNKVKKNYDIDIERLKIDNSFTIENLKIYLYDNFNNELWNLKRFFINVKNSNEINDKSKISINENQKFIFPRSFNFIDYETKVWELFYEDQTDLPLESYFISLKFENIKFMKTVFECNENSSLKQIFKNYFKLSGMIKIYHKNSILDINKSLNQQNIKKGFMIKINGLPLLNETLWRSIILKETIKDLFLNSNISEKINFKLKDELEDSKSIRLVYYDKPYGYSGTIAQHFKYE